jgi:hypothetical protein
MYERRERDDRSKKKTETIINRTRKSHTETYTEESSK